MTETGLVATVSFSMKVNLGNYESADCFISVSNIDLDTTAYEVDELLNGPAQIVYDLIKARVSARANALKSRDWDQQLAANRSRTQNAVQAPGSTKSGPPSPRPKAVPKRHPEGKMGALKAQAEAVLEQLVKAKLVEPMVLRGTHDGSIAREYLRIRLMGRDPWDATNEPDWIRWNAALAKFRDDNIPSAHDLLA